MKLLAKTRTTGEIEAEFKLPVMVTKLLINDIYQNLMISWNKPVNWIINCTPKSSTKYRSILFHLIHHSRGIVKTSRWFMNRRTMHATKLMNFFTFHVHIKLKSILIYNTQQEFKRPNQLNIFGRMII